MAQVQLDNLKTVSFERERGRLTSLTRTGQITGFDDFATTITALAEQSIEADGLPEYGSALAIGDDTLFLVSESYSLAGGDKAAVNVTLTYSNDDEEAGDDLEPSEPSFSTSLEQIETELDQNDAQITVSYDNKTQGGKISVLSPQAELRLAKVFYTNSPGAIALAWVGKTNSTTWNGGTSGLWLCTGVDGSVFNAAEGSWELTFTFQYKPDGWQPQVFYVDPASGEIPSDLVADTGYKTINWYTGKNFHSEFPN